MACELRSERTEDGVVTLWLSSPARKVVVLDAWLIEQLHAFFDALDGQEAPRGFVLRSDNDRVFVAGADLAEIDALDDDGLHRYLKRAADAFGRISALACPSVAVIHGAALGGGLEIAMHCDSLVARLPGDGEKPYRVGLPEAGLGLCPGWGGTQMLPARIDPARAIKLTASGYTPKVTECTEMFIDTGVSDGELSAAAMRFIDQTDPATCQRSTPVCIDASNAQRIRGGLNDVRKTLPSTASAQAVVEAVETGLDLGWAEGTAKERELLVSLRHTQIAREKLKAFFEGQR